MSTSSFLWEATYSTVCFNDGTISGSINEERIKNLDVGYASTDYLSAVGMFVEYLRISDDDDDQHNVESYTQEGDENQIDRCQMIAPRRHQQHRMVGRN